MAPILLKDFKLNITYEELIAELWLNPTWYNKFLTEILNDIKVEISDWVTQEKNHVSDGSNITIKTRQVNSHHPSKISFPGLPSHAESFKIQTMEISTTNNECFIREINTFQGIPYADYFNVITEWKIKSMNKSNNNDPSSLSMLSSSRTATPLSRESSNTCFIEIFLDFKFLKSTWLQGTIESNTKAELLGVFELWYEAANMYIRESMDGNNKGKIAYSKSFSTINNNDMFPVLISSHSQDEISQESAGLLSEDDMEELEFYDCEDGRSIASNATIGISTVKSNKSSSKRNNSLASRPSFTIKNNINTNLKSVFNEELIENNNSSLPISRSSLQHQRRSNNINEGSSTRDMAVNIVEMIFVLAEFSFWQ
eukprot:gene17504-24246_t